MSIVILDGFSVFPVFYCTYSTALHCTIQYKYSTIKNEVLPQSIHMSVVHFVILCQDIDTTIFPLSTLQSICILCIFIVALQQNVPFVIWFLHRKLSSSSSWLQLHSLIQASRHTSINTKCITFWAVASEQKKKRRKIEKL